jgi:23S rRNA (uridine2552-2'-O)-methyltransferase
MREIHDHYFRQAKREGYLSRAAYKLIEIDDRKKILRPGDRVLDCGCAPGSWLQVAARRVGPKGVVVGIDLEPIKFRAANVRTIAGDFTTVPPEDLLRSAGDAARLFDVVLSDMAPSTTGDPFGDHHRSVRLCEAVLDRCPALLHSGGHLIMKVFEGEAYPGLLKRAGTLFGKVRGYKPKASRSESSEMYIVATAFRGSAQQAGEPESVSRPEPKRSAGWTNR